MNIPIAIIVFCGPMAIANWIFAIAFIRQTNDMMRKSESEEETLKSGGKAIMLSVLALLFTALTTGAAFAL